MRKKFTMLFAALLACVGVAKAQDAATYADGLYKVYWQADQRGYLAYHATDYPERPQLAGVVNHNPNGHYALDADGINLGWYLYTSTETQKSYLFEATTGKFITIKTDEAVGNGKACVLSENVTAEAQFNLFASNGNVAGSYLLRYVFNGTDYHFCSGCGSNKGNNPVRFSADGQSDGGNRFVFVTDNESLSITDDVKNAAIAKIQAFESSVVDMVYVYKYGETEWGRETIEANKGEAYPAPAARCGVTYTLPEGNVAADAVNGTEVIITCTLNDEFPFAISTLTDGQFGENMAWYHLTLRSKDVTYDASTGKALTGNVAEKNAANLFAFTGNPFDGYSIYNYVAGADKVLYPENGNNSTRAYFTESASGTWMLYKNTDAGYQFRMKDVENGWLNDHKPDLAIWNYSLGATDGGSTFTFTLVENPDLTTLYEVTYNYMYEGKVIATETSTVEAGAEYPACNYQAPYGVVVGAKPTGNVEATSTHEIALTIEQELPFVAAADVNSIDTWYYARMHTNQPGYIGDITDNNTINVAWGKASDVYSDNYVWGFVGNVFDGITVVNKGTGLQLTSAGSGNVTLTENGTPFFVARTTETSANATNGFCLRRSDSNQYLNANYSAGKLSHWSSTDAGSTFFLTEYEEAAVTVSDVDWATMYLGYATYIPEGVNVYTVASVEDGYVTLNQLEGVIPANTGVLLENAGKFTFKKAAKDPAAVESKLNGTATDVVTSTIENGVVYTLQSHEDGVAFKKFTGETILANKAYLVLPAETKALRIRFAGEETGIDQLFGDEELVIYDLAGRRVEKMEKGIYIVNGKKVVIK